MTEFGYALSSEEHGPKQLVGFARQAEETGLEFAMISDHFHPWTDAQGQSPFVWSVIGGIARETSRLRLGTAVTCPTIRTHPAIVAHAAATSGVLTDGRFFLGVGAGENLNEHVVGEGWPAPDERLAMLEEAIEVMRLLWQGGQQTHRGEHYDVEQARVYTLPEEPVPIAVAAAKPRAAELAGRSGDALINTAPDAEVISTFESAGGQGKPKYGQITMCWAASEQEGAKTACEVWPNAALSGDLTYELPLPEHFEQATQDVTPEDLAEAIPCGPDPDRYLEDIRTYEQAGYTHIYFHQVGRDQNGFFRFWRDELSPKL
ncbi:MAG TPA: TIGR03557 family F420-dependent LLM class oxidoreductase [Gaiellaceae bacterium]|jgi:G6PDH family F420-dependent oxidoreductase|nr:TIGR03557 family F420-dependent LLM class oxidoreductase [Gaiellaceae bacterium]